MYQAITTNCQPLRFSESSGAQAVSSGTLATFILGGGPGPVHRRRRGQRTGVTVVCLHRRLRPATVEPGPGPAGTGRITLLRLPESVLSDFLAELAIAAGARSQRCCMVQAGMVNDG